MSLARGSQRLLRGAFATIVALFLLSRIGGTLLSYRLVRSSEATLNEMLKSVELVGRMARDIDRERLLIERHIFASERAPMSQIEGRIAEARDDFAASARIYRSIPKPPGEERAWNEFEAMTTATYAPISAVLALSRQNLDQQAREALYRLETNFDRIDRDATQLIRQSHARADSTLELAGARRTYGLWISTVFGIIGAAFSAAIGVWVTGLVRRREDELERTASLLEERNRELDAFAGRVAHDLRGPLTTIGLATSRLPAETPEGTSAVLSRGVERMEQLIADLLALSRVDAQVGGRCDPALVATQVSGELEPSLRGGDGTIQVDVAPAEVECPEGLLRQVLWNVADNAVKYRREGVAPRIAITGRPRGGGYDLRISDNGLGMSPDDARHAFEPFYRSVKVRAAPGTGLGLSIVKRIIEVCGGRICVDSQLGRGTTIAIDLPLAHGSHG